jgi:hypothetical protein
MGVRIYGPAFELHVTIGSDDDHSVADLAGVQSYTTTDLMLRVVPRSGSEIAIE